jgi:predicted double-glycine peptidase
MLRFFLVLLGSWALCGCSSVTGFRGIPLTGDSLYVSGLPPLRQDAQYACGPVCVAAVASHWGVTLAEFKARCARAPQDTTGQDLQALAEAIGLQAFVFQGSSDDLRENLRQGRPMIIMITKPPDPALRQTGVLGGLALAISERVPHPSHWVVVIGLLGDEAVIVHDPAAGPIQIKAAAFNKWWAEQSNLCVLIARK